MSALRVATLEETLVLGRAECRERQLWPRMVGGAGYAQIGSSGAVATGTTTAAPAFPQTPTPGNLLVGWFDAFGSTAASTNNQGWLLGKESLGPPATTDVWYKVATASETAPTFTNTGATACVAVICEFAGNVAAPADISFPGAAGTTSPQTSTGSTPDATAGELACLVAAALYTVAQVATTTTTLNNGTYVDVANNDGASDTNHYRFGYAVTTTNATADSGVFAFTTANISRAQITGRSFKVAPAPPPFIPHAMPLGV